MWTKEKIVSTLIKINKQLGYVPTRKVLREMGYSGMFQQLHYLFGGIEQARAKLGLNAPTNNAPKNTWTLESIKEAISALYNETKVFPSNTALVKRYSWGIIAAIRKHGGRKAIAEQLGITKAVKHTREKRIIDLSKGIIEPTNQTGLYLNWKRRADEQGIPNLSKENSKHLLTYLGDAEIGMNMTGRKRLSYARLYALANSLSRICLMIQDNLHKQDITKLSRKEIHDFFFKIGNGTIKRKDGQAYTGVGNLQKDFIAFFNWYVRVNKLNGVTVENVADEIRQEKGNPGFVHFTYEDLKKALPSFTKDEQTLLLFAFDSIVRSPKELSNVRVRDIEIKDNGEVWVSVNDNSSKTFGRTFNLLLCGDEIKSYIARRKLPLDSPLFPEYALGHKFRVRRFPKKLQSVFTKVLGDIVTKGGRRISDVTLYAFRHNGATHLESLGVDSSKIMYRAGWSNYDRLKYYTHHLGHSGKIELSVPKPTPSDNSALLEVIRQLQQQNAELMSLLKKK